MPRGEIKDLCKPRCAAYIDLWVRWRTHRLNIEIKRVPYGLVTRMFGRCGILSFVTELFEKNEDYWLICSVESNMLVGCHFSSVDAIVRDVSGLQVPWLRNRLKTKWCEHEVFVDWGSVETLHRTNRTNRPEILNKHRQKPAISRNSPRVGLFLSAY